MLYNKVIQLAALGPFPVSGQLQSGPMDLVQFLFKFISLPHLYLAGSLLKKKRIFFIMRLFLFIYFLVVLGLGFEFCLLHL